MNPTCTEVDLYGDIAHCAGDVNLPGVRPYFYMVKKSNITGWPTLPSGASIDLGAVATYEGNFALTADKTWKKIDMVPDSATFNSESQGNWGSKTFNNQATLVIPGTKEEVTGMVSMLNNDNCVFLIPGRDGKARVIGNKDFDVTANIKQEQGAAAAGDSAQTTIELSCSDKVSLPFYPGNIVCTSETISGETGEVVTNV